MGLTQLNIVFDLVFTPSEKTVGIKICGVMVEEDTENRVLLKLTYFKLLKLTFSIIFEMS